MRLKRNFIPQRHAGEAGWGGVNDFRKAIFSTTGIFQFPRDEPLENFRPALPNLVLLVIEASPV